MSYKELRYTGWREDLRGRTALKAPVVTKPGRVLVQFNPKREGKEDEQRVYDSLCFGWHDFAADQFEEVKE